LWFFLQCWTHTGMSCSNTARHQSDHIPVGEDCSSEGRSKSLCLFHNDVKQNNKFASSLCALLGYSETQLMRLPFTSFNCSHPSSMSFTVALIFVDISWTKDDFSLNCNPLAQLVFDKGYQSPYLSQIASLV
jgi:hypothetical protein